MIDQLVPSEVRVGYGEIHAHYQPTHGLAEWWVVLIPGRPPYFHVVTP